jgi:hypothetical protein
MDVVMAADLTADVARWQQHHAFAGFEPWLDGVARAQAQAPETWQALLRSEVAFVAQRGPLPAGLDPDDVDGCYADRCLRGAVPTRANNLHDLLNALVWARFPRAKQALCARHIVLASARERTPAGQQRLRSREQDAAAMLDEGGMLLGPTRRAVFGHAALEDAVLGRPLRPFLLHLPSDDLDGALAALLADPQPLPRVRARHAVLGAARVFG